MARCVLKWFHVFRRRSGWKGLTLVLGGSFTLG
jgi:hypothetical protein